MDPKNGAYRPRCGISDGWVPARVVADQLKDGDVKVPGSREVAFLIYIESEKHPKDVQVHSHMNEGLGWDFPILNM